MTITAILILTIVQLRLARTMDIAGMLAVSAGFGVPNSLGTNIMASRAGGGFPTHSASKKNVNL